MATPRIAPAAASPDRRARSPRRSAAGCPRAGSGPPWRPSPGRHRSASPPSRGTLPCHAPSARRSGSGQGRHRRPGRRARPRARVRGRPSTHGRSSSARHAPLSRGFTVSGHDKWADYSTLPLAGRASGRQSQRRRRLIHRGGVPEPSRQDRASMARNAVLALNGACRTVHDCT